MKALQTVLQHRPVRFFENVAPEFDDTVRPNTEDMRVKRSVVQAAKSETVRNNREPLWMVVRQDVRCLKHVA
jgi:hypothetical protein